MKSTGEKLWKQIGSQSLRKQNANRKVQMKEGSKHTREKQQLQQKQNGANDLPCNQLTLGRLQISQIRENNHNEQIFQIKSENKNRIVQDNLQNMLQDIHEINNTFASCKVDGHQVLETKRKYVQACQMFKSILFYLKQQIKYLQIFINKQLSIVKNDHAIYLQNYQKILTKFCNKSKIQRKLNLQKLQQFSHVFEQKVIIEHKLKSLSIQYEGKIKKLIEQNKAQRKNFIQQLQSIIHQKSKVIKQNSILIEKNNNLEQKILFLQNQANKKHEYCKSQSLGENIENEKRFFQDNQNKKNKISELLSVKNSNFSNKFNKSSEKESVNLYGPTQPSPELGQKSPKIYSHKSSGVWQINDQDVQKTKGLTFSNFKMRNSLHNYGKKYSKQDKQIMNNEFNLSINKNMKMSLHQIKTQNSIQKLKNFTESSKLLTQVESQCNFNKNNVIEMKSGMNMLNPKREDPKFTNNYVSKKKSKQQSINQMGQKLTKMRLQIQGEIKHLKSSMSTNI